MLLDDLLTDLFRSSEFETTVFFWFNLPDHPQIPLPGLGLPAFLGASGAPGDAEPSTPGSSGDEEGNSHGM